MLDTSEQLRRLRESWEALAARSLEPNPYFYPEFFLPLLEHGRLPSGLRILAVVGSDGSLLGLLPTTPGRIGPGGVVATLRTAFTPLPPHGLLGTPLLDRERAGPALDAMLDALEGELRPFALLELVGHAVDGSFGQLLVQRLSARRQPHLVLQGWERRLFRRRDTAEAYLQQAQSSRHRSELRRQRRQLERLGRLNLRRLGAGEAVAPWVEAFLGLEASGWKGRSGTALGLDAGDRAFFTAMCNAMHRSALLAFDALELNGRPIAMACSLRAAKEPGAGELVFKIAYDETFARQSPGMQLQLALLADRHGPGPAPAWVDSCAGPFDSLYRRIWLDRRALGHVLIAGRGWWGRSRIAALGLGRWLRTAWRSFQARSS